MKKLLLIAALAAMPAWAQAPADKPAAQEPARKAEPVKKAEASRPSVAAAKKANPRRFEDARHCLEKSTNTEIIKCSEAYL